VISVNSKLFYLINSNDLEYFLASAPHTLDMEEQLKRHMFLVTFSLAIFFDFDDIWD